jgi:hypothetical protein
MSPLVKKLPSGATLEVTMASFEEGEALLSAVAHEVGCVGINLGKDFSGFGDLAQKEVNSDMVNTMKNVVTQILKSRPVKDAVMVCAKRALYNNQHITKETFEPETARQDYLVVLKEVAWFNLLPFFQGINSKLSGIIQKIGSSPA